MVQNPGHEQRDRRGTAVERALVEDRHLQLAQGMGLDLGGVVQQADQQGGCVLGRPVRVAQLRP